VAEPEEDAVRERVRGGLGETVVRGISIAGGGYALSQAVTLGFYLALARLATPEDFGLYAAASVVLGVGFLFTDSGMLAALIHRRDRIEEAANTALISTVLAGIPSPPLRWSETYSVTTRSAR
jgi:O-antigen/teichoic acid export membrane protein